MENENTDSLLFVLGTVHHEILSDWLDLNSDFTACFVCLVFAFSPEKKSKRRLCGGFTRISSKLPCIPLRRQKLPKVDGTYYLHKLICISVILVVQCLTSMLMCVFTGFSRLMINQPNSNILKVASFILGILLCFLSEWLWQWTQCLIIVNR